MLRLRAVLIGIGVIALGIAMVLLARGQYIAMAFYLVVVGLVLVVGIVFERRGYNPKVNRTHGRWQWTGERFIDPTTHHLIEVRFDPETGQRDYVDLGPPPENGLSGGQGRG